jgi:hypothetical protein
MEDVLLDAIAGTILVLMRRARDWDANIPSIASRRHLRGYLGEDLMAKIEQQVAEDRLVLGDPRHVLRIGNRRLLLVISFGRRGLLRWFRCEFNERSELRPFNAESTRAFQRTCLL